MGARTARAPRAGGGRRAGPVLAAVRPLAERVAGAAGLVVWGVEFRREAGRDVLRVAVDRRGGVDADTIARLAEALSRELDAADAVPGEGRYYLEVTSPGAERRLSTPEQFAVCVGRHVRLTFRDGRPPLQGVLLGAEGETVTVDTGGGVASVRLEEVAQARLRVPEV